MTTTTQPPADAVAKDAHWASTLERLRARTRPTTPLRICDDEGAKKALAEAIAEQRRVQYQHDEDPGTPEAKKALKAAESAVAKAQAVVDEATITLTFQAMERPVFEALKKEHPPTEEQAADNFDVNIDTIGPPLIAATNIDGMTEDQAAEFLDTWAEGEAAALFSTAWNIQQTVRMDLGKG